MLKLFCLIFGHSVKEVARNQAVRCPVCRELVFRKKTRDNKTAEGASKC